MKFPSICFNTGCENCCAVENMTLSTPEQTTNPVCLKAAAPFSSTNMSNVKWANPLCMVLHMKEFIYSI